MHYIFIINGREDKAFIVGEVERQIKDLNFSYEIYITEGPGDATRYVNIYCDFNPKQEVCFIASGGSGTVNEVVSAIVDKPNKYLAILAFSGTNDFTKCYPDLNFQSVKAILDGSPVQIDAIKANDYYGINVINIGMDVHVVIIAERLIQDGIKDTNEAYAIGVKRAVLLHRIKPIRVVADGKPLNKHFMLLTTVGNGHYYGGQYHCCPNAVVDDGWLEVTKFRFMPLIIFAIVAKMYQKGTHLQNRFARHFTTYTRARHIELISKDLIYLGIDGELVASSHFDIDVLDKAINLILPAKQ